MKESKPTGKTVSGNNTSFVINKFKFSSSEINKKTYNSKCYKHPIKTRALTAKQMF